METSTHLRAIRERRGLSAASLARLAGVTRQTVHAIEAGSYVPNTTVALQLAKLLEVRVEELFCLKEPQRQEAKPVSIDYLTEPKAGQLVQVCQVGHRMVGVCPEADATMLPEADGIAVDSHHAQLFPAEGDSSQHLLIAGCDPGVALLARSLDAVVASCSSRQALAWLKQGKVHVAGTHLKDASGVYNLGAIKSTFPQGAVKVVTFAVWEQGLVTRQGSPIRTVDDLANPKVRIVNRQEGAGSRALLDQHLAQSGIPATRVKGYDSIAMGHLPAALAVSEGRAACCVATRSAARAFGLGFIPLATERYDLVIPRKFAKLPAAEALLDLLNRSALRKKLAMLAGYDTSHTGEVLVA